LHSAKDPFAERNGHNTRQSWQNGRSEKTYFPALPSVVTITLGKEIKKN